MQQIYKLPLVLDPQPEGGWTISCPLLPGLNTEADTFEEVVPNVSDALKALIELYEDLGRPLPSILKSITLDAPFLMDTAIQLEVELDEISRGG